MSVEYQISFDMNTHYEGMSRSLKAVEKNKTSNSAGRMSISHRFAHELAVSSDVEGCLGDNEGIFARHNVKVPS